jgi:hypothetical protein
MNNGKDKGKQMLGKNETSIVRSSAAGYLTFVAAGGSSEASVEMRYEDENLWLTQKMMATLYDVSVPAINQHMKRIFADNELEEAAVVKQYLTTAADGKNYRVKHYRFTGDHRRRVQDRKRTCRAVPQMGQPDCQGLHHSGLDDGCGTPETRR